MIPHSVRLVDPFELSEHIDKHLHCIMSQTHNLIKWGDHLSSNPISKLDQTIGWRNTIIIAAFLDKLWWHQLNKLMPIVVFELVFLFTILKKFVQALKGCNCKIWMDELKYKPVMDPQTVLFGSQKNTNCVVQFMTNAY